MLGILAPDTVFDLVERGDPHQRLVDDGRSALWRGLDQLPTSVRPTECQLQGIATHPVRRGEVRVTAIGIHLDCAVEPIEDLCGILAFPSGPIMEHHARRRRAVPTTVVAQHGPTDNRSSSCLAPDPALGQWSHRHRALCFPTAAVWPCDRPPGQFRCPCGSMLSSSTRDCRLQSGKKKKRKGRKGPPEPTLPAIRRAVISALARPMTTIRCPHCKAQIRATESIASK